MEKNDNKFMTGFLWGVIIGGVCVYLLSTKKGKNILKELSDNGFDLLEQVGEDVNEFDSSNQGEKPLPKSEVGVSSESGSGLGRRFFKGIKRKS